MTYTPIRFSDDLLPHERTAMASDKVRATVEGAWMSKDILEVLKTIPNYECHGFEPSYEGSPIIQPARYLSMLAAGRSC